MSNEELFYQERDRRTVAYGIDPAFLKMPVAIAIGSRTAATPAGQVAILALANMVARVHRNIRIIAPQIPLHVGTLVEGRDLATVCEATARAINPFIQVQVADPAGSRSLDGIPTIGVGGDAPGGCSAYLFADRFIGGIGVSAEPWSDSPSTMIGAAAASLFGASDLLRAVLGHSFRVRRLSLWDFTEGAPASPGSEAYPVPVDVGDVAVIGAGAVGSSLAYWLCQFGVIGKWVFVDGDEVELHNTNRSLSFLAVDAGWADGHPGGKKRLKAEISAAVIGASHFFGWYADWVKQDSNTRYDLVLPLANGPGVRHAIGQRGESILIHATTSPIWTAELHRHVPDEDDCIDCRLPERASVQFNCSVGRIELREGTDRQPRAIGDAALPFLSGAAGLLVAVALMQLQEGTFVRHRHNHWRLFFGDGDRIWWNAIFRCLATCRSSIPRSVRAQVNASKRWADVGQ